MVNMIPARAGKDRINHIPHARVGASGEQNRGAVFHDQQGQFMGKFILNQFPVFLLP
jgi:hypothetical protein